jgi:hypothetical protein
MDTLPKAVAEIVDLLVRMRGTVAVVLGGSRAAECADAASDWDLTVYYRREIDLRELAKVGTVHPPGAWGRLMNGGSWLQLGGLKIDVLLRDLNVAEYWTERAARGEYEVDGLLGYLAGVPTYSLSAELATGRALRGDIPAVASFPGALAESAPARWRSHRAFSIEYARMQARHGNSVGAVGQTMRAIMEEAHAIVCERRQWVLNEKRLITKAGLGVVQRATASVPVQASRLLEWIGLVDQVLQGAPLPATGFELPNP